MEDELNTPAGGAVDPRSGHIVDPHAVPTVFTDELLACGHANGVLNVTLGAVDYTYKLPDQDLYHVWVTSRLRMSLDMAERLHDALGKVVAAARSGRPLNFDPNKAN